MDSQHKDHRKRVRQRYTACGLDVFQDYEALELLLFYAIPMKDTKALAKTLIEHFGSLPAVLDADLSELQEAGLTENTAILLNMIPAMNRRYEVLKNENQKYIRSTSEAGQYLCGLFRNELEESIRIVCLDAAGKIIKQQQLSKGDVNAVHFSVRKIVEAAVSTKAVSVILAHNHPAGSLTPSQEDISATNVAKAALDTIGVRLLDHLIVSGRDYCSLRESGYL